MSTSIDTSPSARVGGATPGLPGVERIESVERIDPASGVGYLVDPRVIDAAVTHAATLPRSVLPVLTRRERAILAELATGRSNAGIAEHLELSERTVEKHINALFAKLGLTEDGISNRRVRAALLFLAATSGSEALRGTGWGHARPHR